MESSIPAKKKKKTHSAKVLLSILEEKPASSRRPDGYEVNEQTHQLVRKVKGSADGWMISNSTSLIWGWNSILGFNTSKRFPTTEAPPSDVPHMTVYCGKSTNATVAPDFNKDSFATRDCPEHPS